MEARIALKNETSRADVSAFAWHRNWDIEGPGREGDEPFRQVWSTLPDMRTVVTYLEDPFVDLRYLAVHGPDAEATCAAIHRGLQTWHLDEALDFLASAGDRDEKVHGVYVTAVTAPPGEEDERILAAFRAVSGDDEVDARHALLIGIAYLGHWGSLRALATELHRDDDTASARRDAGFLLEGLDLPEYS
ncbi:hypothetical protein SAMN05216215_10152 [Saccharopolyspora shandongensis]|uniref:HEAT repeat-containing protein n=1 Tax=Saccharopolyspora shandongensis TaxID=418495 RepID=A0A1H3EHQ2_9PSEU|nr:hypothetical protein [Saccharopolyspora shandongensis]SDX77738.1 hypothetical protein SAMN05216215_10152 [Saccharopolyspora shandongensis]